MNTIQLAEELKRGSRRALAKAITLVESTLEEHRAAAERLMDAVADSEQQPTLRVGISGAPGVGKSTFIEALGTRVVGDGHRLAVLAVDPSSRMSGGSILGDKTRMQELSRTDAVFVRPSPAGSSLGGVARRTRESVQLCEAAGYDVVFVETVGVGQSEVAVAEMTDLFVLLLSPAGGDDLQGIKRGIMELTDIAVVNKADGELVAAAGRAAADLRNALRMMRPRSAGWTPRVLSCSALEQRGMDEVWHQIDAFRTHAERSGLKSNRRSAQSVDWFWHETREMINARLLAEPNVAALAESMQHAVVERRISVSSAARRIVDAFLGSQRSASLQEASSTKRVQK